MTVTVIDIRSLSYTGTTWINLLAGSHPQVFTVVLPQRIYAALRGEVPVERLCMVHGPRCEFWPTMLGEIDPDANLYREIARLSGTTHVAINNPFIDPKGLTDLEDPDVDVRKITVVRDGRATIASFLSRSDDASVSDAIDWLVGNAGLAEAAPGQASLRIRYEDVVTGQRAVLGAIGEFVGLSYSDDAVRFWDHEHHPGGGNPGPLAMIRRHLSGRAGDPADSAEQRYQRVLADPLDVDNAERWRTQLDAAALALFAERAGDLNERWGYPADPS